MTLLSAIYRIAKESLNHLDEEKNCLLSDKKKTFNTISQAVRLLKNQDKDGSPPATKVLTWETGQRAFFIIQWTDYFFIQMVKSL